MRPASPPSTETVDVLHANDRRGRAFHDELLGAGALPLDVLEARMKRWLEQQQEP